MGNFSPLKRIWIHQYLAKKKVMLENAFEKVMLENRIFKNILCFIIIFMPSFWKILWITTVQGSGKMFWLGHIQTNLYKYAKYKNSNFKQILKISKIQNVNIAITIVLQWLGKVKKQCQTNWRCISRLLQSIW